MKKQMLQTGRGFPDQLGRFANMHLVFVFVFVFVTYLDDLVHLVPHLRSLEIVARRHGGLASSSEDC